MATGTVRECSIVKTCDLVCALLCVALLLSHLVRACVAEVLVERVTRFGCDARLCVVHLPLRAAWRRLACGRHRSSALCVPQRASREQHCGCVSPLWVGEARSSYQHGSLAPPRPVPPPAYARRGRTPPRGRLRASARRQLCAPAAGHRPALHRPPAPAPRPLPATGHRTAAAAHEREHPARRGHSTRAAPSLTPRAPQRPFRASGGRREGAARHHDARGGAGSSHGG